MRDRRRATRIPAKLVMELRLSGKDITRAESIDVSANGIYFTSHIYIEPLTKLEITLLLPMTDSRGSSIQPITCEGVVVRTEPEKEIEGRDSYDVACYFTSIPDQEKEQLEAYILKQLAF